MCAFKFSFSVATQFPTLDYSLACIPLFWFAEEYITTKLTSGRHTNEYELFTHAQTSKCVVTYENTESSEHFETMFGISFFLTMTTSKIFNQIELGQCIKIMKQQLMKMVRILKMAKEDLKQIFVTNFTGAS